MGLYLQFYHCMSLFVYLTVCVSLQERAHFESLGHHLGKLGEEGKIGHRVIDLTRPEDLDGKATFWFFSYFVFHAHNSNRWLVHQMILCVYVPLWSIKTDGLRLDKVQWVLYKIMQKESWFLIKPATPCGLVSELYMEERPGVCRNMCVCVRKMWGLGWMPFERGRGAEFSQVGERRTRVPEDKAGFSPSSAPVAVVLVWGPGHKGVNSCCTSVTKRHLPLWRWFLHRSKEYLSAPMFVRHKYLWQFPWHFRVWAKRKMLSDSSLMPQRVSRQEDRYFSGQCNPSSSLNSISDTFPVKFRKKIPFIISSHGQKDIFYS